MKNKYIMIFQKECYMMKYQDFSETGEKTVAYIALYGDNKLQARPQDMFLDEVNKNGQKYKFELQDIKSVLDERIRRSICIIQK